LAGGNADVIRLRKQRDDMRRTLREMEKATIPVRDPDLVRLERAKARTDKQIADYQAKIKAGDYTEPVKREPIKLDRELLDKQYELARAKEDWQVGLIEKKRAARPLPQKLKDSVIEAGSLVRMILTSADLPPLFRQGVIALTRPVIASKAVGSAYRAMFSEKYRNKIQQRIEQSPNAPLYKMSKLAIADDVNRPLSQQEEQYMGNWYKNMTYDTGEKLGIAGWPVRLVAGTAGAILRGSERSYNTFLNVLRSEMFDSAMRAYSISDTDLKSMKALAEVINTFTGRSKLWSQNAEQAVPFLNSTLFAPRFLMSRINLTVGQPIWGNKGQVRKFATEQYARLLGGALLMYQMAKMAGYEVITDPRSSKFSQIKIGDGYYIDPMGGMFQLFSLGTRLLSGEAENGKGQIRPFRENIRPLAAIDEKLGTNLSAGGKPSGSGWRTIMTFVRGKLHPIPSGVADLIDGKDIQNQPVTLKDVILARSVPINWQGVIKTMQDLGYPKGPTLWMSSMHGMGLKKYSE
jgi:acylphosphatase